MSLLNTIKKAGLGAIEATSPVQIVYGEIKEPDPLVIIIDQRFELTQEFLVVPESLTEYIIQCGDHEHIIRKKLEKGEKVSMIRIQGGNSYLLLDRV